MLHLHFSNRLDTLAAGLLDLLDQARPASAWDDEVVVVPSAAVRRWLQRRIALHRGVCAGVAFPFLARWLWQLSARVLPQVGADSPFSPPVLAWRVHAALGDAAFTAPHPTLHRYLAQADEVMRFELAGRIAAQLEQYVTYRPGWLQAWQMGRVLGLDGEGTAGDEAWQAALWQRLARELSLAEEHPVHAMARALQGAPAHALAAAGLQQPLHVFALPGMPPVYLGALQGLAAVAEVHVHALNPCQHYWYEAVDRRRLAWLHERGRGDGHEIGNRLLSAWGGAAQAHLGALCHAAGDGVLDDARFVDPPTDTLLGAWQRSVLEMEELGPGSHPLAADDRSVEVHVCHSLTRQVEVLHDHLLGLLADNPRLHPSRVLVVTPDLEAAAPLVEAVFGGAPRERRIDFSITGRARSTVNPVARALLDLLSLADSRLPATALYGVLQQPPVARRFGLDPLALQQLLGALRDSGLRWGFDGAHRAALGLPGDNRHTLDDTLQRLFLAEALPDDADEPFAGRWPAGSGPLDSATLGTFWRFVQALRSCCARVSTQAAPTGWASTLRDTVETFIDPGPEGQDDLREVLAAVDSVTAAMRSAGLDASGAAPVPLAVVRTALQEALDDPAHGGVPGGGVTFASMSSMRGLPFDVLCVLGLDDGAFPGRSQAAEFDLIARHPQRGDRQRRIDDRQLFLDLLLAADQHVALFFTGRSVRDNAPLPPSVLVSEWVDDVLVPAAAANPDDAASRDAMRRRLVVEHPLQPFSPECFDPSQPRRQSFDAELAQAVRQGMQALAETAGQEACARHDSAEGGSQGSTEEGAEESGDEAADQSIDESLDESLEESAEAGPQARFFRAPLPPVDAGWHEVNLESLAEFLRHPAQYLLRRRMGLHLAWDEEAPDDDEPFDVSWSAQRALAARLVPLLVAGQDPEAVARAALAGTELPAGDIGEADLSALMPTLVTLAQRWRTLSAAAPLPPHTARLTATLDAQPWSLQGQWSDLRPEGLVRWRAAALSGADRLEAWAHHLLLCADPPPSAPPRTVWLALGSELAFAPVPAAQARVWLEDLLRLYQRGLREPLRLFPKASWAYVESKGSASMARNAWARHSGSGGSSGESLQPAHRLAWRGRDDALGGDFDAIARQVFGPLRSAIEGGTLPAADPPVPGDTP